PEVKELAWKINPYRVTVYLKNGKTESYNMESPVEKTNAVKKYGEFPYPPPPPPAPPVAKQAKIPLPAPLRTPPPPPKPAEADKSIYGYPKDFNPPAQDEIKDF